MSGPEAPSSQLPDPGAAGLQQARPEQSEGAAVQQIPACLPGGRGLPGGGGSEGGPCTVPGTKTTGHGTNWTWNRPRACAPDSLRSGKQWRTRTAQGPRAGRPPRAPPRRWTRVIASRSGLQRGRNQGLLPGRGGLWGLDRKWTGRGRSLGHPEGPQDARPRHQPRGRDRSLLSPARLGASAPSARARRSPSR